MSSDRPLVSVVIPTFQRRDSLRRALAGLARQTLLADRFEVVVSVDGSTDGSVEMLETYSAPYRLRVHRQANAGRASARNAGIALASGDLVVILDDDMDPPPGFLAAHIDAHGLLADSRDHRPEVAALWRRAVVGAVPVVVPDDATPVQRYVARRFATHIEKLAQPGCRIGIRDFYSGNFSIPRALLLEVGAFDPRFAEYGNEDSDLMHRLRAAGEEVVFSRDALARQHYRKGFREWANDSMAKGRTAVVLAGKHPDEGRESSLWTHRQGSWRFRLLRSVLLAASDLVRAFPGLVTGTCDALNRRRVRWLLPLLPILVDYYFWLGVRSSVPRRPVDARDLAAGEGWP